MRIAFYAPIKPPDHHIPSGDRLIAKNLIKALQLAGFTVDLASRFIAYSKRSDQQILLQRKAAALEEANRLAGEFQKLDPDQRPQMWLTYHPYCKAPDWIGPVVSAALAIPYVTIEACKTGQGDAWLDWRAEAQSGIRQADKHLWFKPMDRDYLTELLGDQLRLARLPPFIDCSDSKPPAQMTAPQMPTHWHADVPVLISVGMMRKGKKDQNFLLMADILQAMQQTAWNLLIVGGGPEEPAVRQAFSPIDTERIHWCGQVASAEVGQWMDAADIFIWPGWKEPIGMVYLEAALRGLPSVAFDNMGVPLVVQHQKTGLLSPPDDLDGYRKNLKLLLGNRQMCRELGKNARQFVINERSIEAVIPHLQNSLSPLFLPTAKP